MEDGEDWTPFWLQNTTNTRRTDRLRQRISSVFFSSGLVVILLLITAIFFLAFVVPSTLSFSSQIFRPNSVKKSWDSLNIVLVLVAVVFGFLSKIKTDDRYSYYDELQSSPNKQNEVKKSPTKASTSDQWYNNYNNFEANNNASSSNQWYGYSDHHKDSILRRNSISYPDLREFSSNRWDYQRRFYDDFQVDASRLSDTGHRHSHRRHRSVEEVDIVKAAPPPPSPTQAKTIFIDTLSQSREETPPLPQTIPTYEAHKRKHERIERRKERSKKKLNKETAMKPPVPDQAPLPPPPSPPQNNTNVSSTNDFFDSIYHKKTTKPSQQKSFDNLNSLLHQPQSPLNFKIPAPPPPPPPPPPPQNLFNSKKHKRKRSTITVPVTVTPSSNPNPQIPPPKIIHMKSFDKIDESSNSGGESPLHRMPPPPPPPPPGFFKTPAWKFVVQGDYVRVDSLSSSRSDSPDLDDVEDSDVTPDAASFHGSPLSFYPSPDVNGKAESFISNFRANLKFEKNHSLHKREVGLSSLGR